ncbi:uncharacterized protein LOC129601973 [Paramacrobiotus metropolitanus]|uniref:uncharacterized protein LOC129601973 n=1 Tax=Paramacrobiotus metropolitanus TaxID=2943436 RepID=UPI0024464471|nr:uncharacterized protein LOC129601973 [Paramacrobiotus metropolitanus]
MNSWPMPPYERLLVDVNQLSYHNTVAVRNEDGAYWLGHIQDIVGDYTLIHFAGKKVPASWIHAGRVWPLSALRYSDWKDVPVMVALRDEDDGPLRFRRAVVLNHVIFLGEPYMYFIRTDGPGAGSESCTGRTELVDVCQIVGQSAWDEPALLYRSSGLIFRKHFIPFARAQEVLRDGADKLRIIQRCCRTYRKDVAYMGGCPYYDRFHLRTEASGCTFIIISRAGGVETEQQSVAALSALLQAHVDSRADRPPTDYGDLCGHGRALGGEDMRAAIQSSDTVISDLPLLLLCEVFAHHDLHSCMRLKRVCALWLALLSRPQATEHISICFETCSCTKMSPDLNYGKVASLLSRTVNVATKSITVLQLFSSPARLRNLLVAMGITVPTIMFKGCTVTTCAPYSIYRCYGAEPDRLRYAVAMQPAEFDACCRRVLLYNWTVYEMFGDAIFELLYCSTPHVIDDLVPLPPTKRSGWRA